MVLKEVNKSKDNNRLCVYTHTGIFGVEKWFKFVNETPIHEFLKNFGKITLDEQIRAFKFYSYDIIDNNNPDKILFKFIDGSEIEFLFIKEKSRYWYFKKNEIL